MPRIEREAGAAPRLDAPVADHSVESGVDPAGRPTGLASPVLAIAGVLMLVLGLGALQTGNFVAAEFARARWLGWLTLMVAVAGFGLILGAIGYELRGLMSLDAVDRLRADLASEDPLRRQRAARRWSAILPEGAVLRPALDAVNDPDALLALLREGPGRRLRMEADALGRRAAMQVAAALTAVPSPGLAGLLIAWRGLRLLRQVAVLHGLRPGVLGTLGLMRRTVFAAGAVAAGEAAANAAAHALLSNPLLGKLAGDLAGAGLAARRMMVMARAAGAACSPLSHENGP